MIEGELKVEGTMENLPAVLEFIAGSLRKHHVDDVKAFEIRLAVDEIATNVITHAYKSMKGNIRVACRRDNDDIVITIKDEGAPFDPTKVPLPDLTPDLDRRKVGGLGIYFAKKVMDTVVYRHEEGSNVLMMTKMIK
jgi:serine/threonine-protein kinase RsbW